MAYSNVTRIFRKYFSFLIPSLINNSFPISCFRLFCQEEQEITLKSFAVMILLCIFFRTPLSPSFYCVTLTAIFISLLLLSTSISNIFSYSFVVWFASLHRSLGLFYYRSVTSKRGILVFKGLQKSGKRISRRIFRSIKGIPGKRLQQMPFEENFPLFLSWFWQFCVVFLYALRRFWPIDAPQSIARMPASLQVWSRDTMANLIGQYLVFNWDWILKLWSGQVIHWTRKKVENPRSKSVYIEQNNPVDAVRFVVGLQEKKYQIAEIHNNSFPSF